MCHVHEGGREESSDRQHYLQQLSQLLVFPFFLHGTAQLFSCDDCSEHGDGEHNGLLRGGGGGVVVPQGVGRFQDGLAG